MRDSPHSENRLIAQDKKTNVQFLIDTGADLSLLLRSWKVRGQPPSTFQLFAANDTVISTYGRRKLHLNLGLRRVITWVFLVVDVAQPIIGVDFLKHFGLLVDLKRKRLLDETTVPLSIYLQQLFRHTHYSWRQSLQRFIATIPRDRHA